jgi:hypothetical protein
MAGEPVVHIGENSPEQVAFRLLQIIADVEGRQLYGHGENKVDREWLLKTYSQCIFIVNRSSNVEDVLKRFNPEK